MGDREKQSLDGTSNGGGSPKRLRLATPQVPARARVAAMFLVIITAVAAVLEDRTQQQKRRQGVIERPRMDWDEHMSRSIREKTFRRKYRMDPEIFCKLVDLLRPALERNADFARLRTSSGVVSVESRVAIALRILAGGSYLNVMDVHGVAMNTTYLCLWQVIDAINNTEGVGDFNFPQTRADCMKMALKFQALSTNRIISGCVGAVDGLHIPTVAPSRNTVLNVLDYYSENKKSYGLNVQAIATATGRFSAVSTVAPGSANDWRAWNRSSLADATARLPRGFYLLGDAAYPLSEQLLTPYPGRKLPKDKDSLNFHLSQGRIRVEMAFGTFVQTWGILWRDLKVKTEGRPDLITALFRLHNFLHDEGVAPVSVEEEDTESRALRPSLSADGGDGDILPERFRTPSDTPRKAGETPTRAALTALLEDHRQYRPSPDQPTLSSTATVGITAADVGTAAARPVNSPSMASSERGTQQLQAVLYPQAVPSLPGFMGLVGAASSRSSCVAVTTSPPKTCAPRTSYMDQEEYLEDGVDFIDVDIGSRHSLGSSINDGGDSSVSSGSRNSISIGEESSRRSASPSSLPDVQAHRKGPGRKPGVKRPTGSYESWTTKHLKAAGRHRGIKKLSRFGKKDKGEMVKLLVRQDEQKGRQSPFVDDIDKWIEDRIQTETPGAMTAKATPSKTSGARAPNSPGAGAPGARIPPEVILAYESAVSMGAQPSPERKVSFGGISYLIRDVQAAAKREKDAAAGAAPVDMVCRRKTKNCLPRLCNILSMGKHRHRLLLSKQPVSRADLDAKKVRSATNLWKEVLQDYLDPKFETGGVISDAVELAHIDPRMIGQPELSVEKLHGMWSETVREWNNCKTNHGSSGSNSPFWEFCRGSTDVLYLHETFNQYSDLKSFGDAVMPEDIRREDNGLGERKMTGRSGAEADADRRKAAKAKAVSNVAAAREHDKKEKAAKEGGQGESVAAAIAALMPAIKEAFAVPDAGSGLSKSAGDVEELAFERTKRAHDEEDMEKTKRARDERIERNKQAQEEESERRKRAHFQELMKHVRFLQSEISEEKAKNEPDEFLMSLLDGELTGTTLSLKKLSQKKIGTNEES